SERLAAPPLRLDEAKQAAFATLWQAVKAAGDGRYIDYTLPYPKHEFLRYVDQLDEVIFHGSNNADIAEFRPVRTSYELRDSTGRGNLQAVYGTHDGIWAMFFAIIDRQRLVGSINNGVMYFENAAGETLAMYNFSVSEQSLAERPWCAGTMYLLPRDTFVRLELGNGVPANEWASETAVRPLARLALQPEDFPFLTDIRGHDDGQLIRFNELSRVVLAAATGAAEPQPDVFRLTLDWRAELGPALLEYVALLREFVPTVRLALQFEPENGPVRLEIGGPPAFAQVLRGRLGEKLGVSREP
ncbi:MAG: hypothetical protein KC425_22755, partial [Anaerolineales bacterium]|nr:hypothetical protein [Anaerolineales bacterium]